MTNAYGTLSVLRACENSKTKKLIHASTGSVMSGKPVSYYGVSKYAAECYIESGVHDVDYTIFRYFNVYGIGQEYNKNGAVIPTFIYNALAGKPLTIFGSGEQVRHFTVVDDVVNANIISSSLDISSHKIYSVVSDISITINELVKIISDIVKSNYNIVTNIRYAPEREQDIFEFSNVSNRKIKHDMGISFSCDIEKNIMEIIEWHARKIGIVKGM